MCAAVHLARARVMLSTIIFWRGSSSLPPPTSHGPTKDTTNITEDIRRASFAVPFLRRPPAASLGNERLLRRRGGRAGHPRRGRPPGPALPPLLLPVVGRRERRRVRLLLLLLLVRRRERRLRARRVGRRRGRRRRRARRRPVVLRAPAPRADRPERGAPRLARVREGGSRCGRGADAEEEDPAEEPDPGGAAAEQPAARVGRGSPVRAGG